MRRYLAAVNLLLLICVVSLYFFFAMWCNTLYNNGNWESSKVKLGKGVIGSVLFWDNVHLTDYGQLLFAEKLFAALKQDVCEAGR